jgi:hypothetical protein
VMDVADAADLAHIALPAFTSAEPRIPLGLAHSAGLVSSFARSPAFGGPAVRSVHSFPRQYYRGVK